MRGVVGAAGRVPALPRDGGGARQSATWQIGSWALPAEKAGDLGRTRCLAFSSEQRAGRAVHAERGTQSALSSRRPRGVGSGRAGSPDRGWRARQPSRGPESVTIASVFRAPGTAGRVLLLPRWVPPPWKAAPAGTGARPSAAPRAGPGACGRPAGSGRRAALPSAGAAAHALCSERPRRLRAPHAQQGGAHHPHCPEEGTEAQRGGESPSRGHPARKRQS